MSQHFIIELERRTPQGWVNVGWDLPPVSSDTPRPQFDPSGFRDRVFFYVLTSIAERVDPDDCPKPLVDQPRGVPADLSPDMVKATQEQTYLLHWLYASEVVGYDWRGYEDFRNEQLRQFERRYEARNGRPYTPPRPYPEHHAPVEFLDVVAALDPLEDHRLLCGIE